MRNIVKNTPFESFPNYTDEMYMGEIPCGKGGRYVVNGDFEHPVESDRWSYCHGGGESIGDDIMNATVSINVNDSVFLCGSTIAVNHIRHYKNYCISIMWCNDGKLNGDAELEYDKAIATINKLNRCKFERMVKEKIMDIIKNDMR